MVERFCILPSYGVWGHPTGRPAGAWLSLSSSHSHRVLTTTQSWVWTPLSSISSLHAVHGLGSSYQEKFWSHLLLEQQCLNSIRSGQGSWSTLQQQHGDGTRASWTAFVTTDTQNVHLEQGATSSYFINQFLGPKKGLTHITLNKALWQHPWYSQCSTAVFPRPWLCVAGGHQVGLAGARAQTLHQRATEAAASGTEENRNATLSWLPIWSWQCGCIVIHS